MCIRKIEAYAYDGKTYTREIDAIIAAVAKRIGNNEAIARNVIDSARDIVPLLGRALDIAAEEQRKKAPAPIDEKDPPADEDDDNSYSGPALNRRSEIEP